MTEGRDAAETYQDAEFEIFHTGIQHFSLVSYVSVYSFILLALEELILARCIATTLHLELLKVAWLCASGEVSQMGIARKSSFKTLAGI